VRQPYAMGIGEIMEKFVVGEVIDRKEENSLENFEYNLALNI